MRPSIKQLAGATSDSGHRNNERHISSCYAAVVFQFQPKITRSAARGHDFSPCSAHRLKKLRPVHGCDCVAIGGQMRESTSHPVRRFRHLALLSGTRNKSRALASRSNDTRKKCAKASGNDGKSSSVCARSRLTSLQFPGLVLKKDDTKHPRISPTRRQQTGLDPCA